MSKKQSNLFSFWNKNPSSRSNANRTPARNTNINTNNNNQTVMTPQMRAHIEEKRRAALERRRQRELQQNQTPHTQNNTKTSSLTPAINRIRMTPNNMNRNNNNLNNGNINNINNNRTPLTNTTNTTTPAPVTNDINNKPSIRTSTRKRTRKQYHEQDSDDSPVQPRKKARRSNNKRQIADSDDDYNPTKEVTHESEDYSEHSPSTSPKRKGRPSARRNNNTNNGNNNDNDIDFDDDMDIEINDNSNNTNNKNKTISIDPKLDTLERIAAFELYDSDDEKKNETISRDSKFIYKDYNDYKRKYNKRINNANKLAEKGKKKPAGASHRDVSQFDWYKNPKDKNNRSPNDPNYNPTQISVPQFYLKNMTPSQQQYWKVKSTHFDGILCFKVGKFYELYYMDADIGHKLCGLSYMGGEAPHVGFPERSFNKFAESFVKHGYKVYRVEQTQTVKEQKEEGAKIVRREVCEVISKGTIVPEEFLDDRSNFILSIVEEEENKVTSSIDVGICYMDFSIGKIYIGRFMDDRNRSRLRTLMYQINPSEIIFKKGRISKETNSLIKMDGKDAMITPLISDEQFYDSEQTKNLLKSEEYWKNEKYPSVLMKAFGHDLTMNAFGGILYMLQSTMHDHEILPHSTWNIYDPTSTKCNKFLTLDGSTLGNLEILRNDSGTKRGTLIEFIDHCSTKFGKRMMERWLRAPLNKLNLINERLDAVDYLILDTGYWIDELGITSIFNKLPDLERLLHNLAVLGTKNRAMDKAIMFNSCWKEIKVKKLLSALDGFEEINNLLITINKHRNQINSKLINDITTVIEIKDEVNDNDIDEEKDNNNNNNNNIKNDRHMIEFGSLILNFRESFKLVEEGTGVKKTKIIQPIRGKNEEFDDVMDKLEENEKKLQKILRKIQREFKCTKIKYWHKKNATKIKDKYLIEIPKNLGIEAPDEWHHRSETSKLVRYHTDAILKILSKNDELFSEKEDLIRDSARLTFAKFAKYGNIWKKIVENIGIFDCLLSLAYTSQYADTNMVRPQFIARKQNENSYLEIRECVHPCITSSGLNVMRQENGASTFIPNDTVLGCKENLSNFVIVTGPNMGGKSTLLRQTCIAVILAHVGCYVPCKLMKLTPVDRIFTRVGANDRILAGQSTFMVELEETSNILRHATSNSLVILDELGRGTSTFDGTAIAYAVAKQLIDKIKCRSLFSTHYHGLCDSFINNIKVSMYHMNFKQDGDKITFLYKFTKGICKNSHGINCAKLAFDKIRFKDMLQRAQEKSNMLHNKMHSQQDFNQEKELIKQFRELMLALDGDIWTKIQKDINNNQMISG